MSEELFDHYDKVSDQYALPMLLHPEKDERWRSEAECRKHPEVDFFYGPTAPAIAICQNCSVSEACLNFAVDNEIYYGVYGGLSGKDRRWWPIQQEPS